MDPLEGCSHDFNDTEEVSWLSRPSQSEKEQRWTGYEEEKESHDEDQQSEEEPYCGRSMESSS